MTDPLNEAERAALAGAADAFENAWAPYSGFRVGAAVRTADGRVFSGCNVENATYGATVCAERNAVAAAVRAGARAVSLCVVYTDHTRPTPPCGICRQVLREFGRDATVLSITASGATARWTLAELLPDSFGPDDLGEH